MLKKQISTKRLKRLTLGIAILSFINALMWYLITEIIFATHRADDWHSWGISTMNFDKVLVWQANEILQIVFLLLLPFPFFLFMTMGICYLRMRKNKAVSKTPYYTVLGFQVFLIVFSFVAKLFVLFGAFWVSILLLSVLSIVEFKKECRINNTD